MVVIHTIDKELSEDDLYALELEAIYEPNSNAQNSSTHQTYFRNWETISKLKTFLVMIIFIIL